VSNPEDRNEPEVDFAPLGIHSNAPGRSIDIIKFAVSIWKTVVLGLVAGLVLGVLTYLYLGPAYEANTRVLVSKKASVPFNSGEANRYGDVGEHIHLIMSEEIVRRALENHGLAEHPEYAGSADPYEDILDNLIAKRSAGEDNDFLNVINITFIHQDKDIAKTVLEAIVAAYDDWLLEHRDANADQLMHVLSQRQVELQGDIEDLEQEHFEFWSTAPFFLKSSPIVMANGMSMPAPSYHELQLQQIEQEHSRAIGQRVRIEAQMAALDQMVANGESREDLEWFVLNALSSPVGGGTADSGGSGGGGTAILAGPPAKAELDSRLLTARLMEARLLDNLGENHPDVRRAHSQVESILQFYRTHGITPPALGASPTSTGEDGAGFGVDLVSVFRKTLEFQLDQLGRQIEIHQERLLAAQETVKEATLVERRDQQYKDQIAEKKVELADIGAQINSFLLSREQEGYRMDSIAQTRVAISTKRILKIVGACGLLGMFCVFGLSYFREWYDTRMKTLDEVRRALGVAVMGAVPRLRPQPDSDQLMAGSGLDPALCYFHRPGSREAEAYRKIRTTLFHTLTAGQKVIQITSAEPGDGKSVTTANLAIAIAQSGKNVLLIDGDLRRPRVHELFGVAQDHGLSDVLRGDRPASKAFKQSRVPGLQLLTSGHCPANPAELLSVGGLETLLGDVRKQFDIVIIDSPPVLAVSDPTIIAPLADGVLPVIRMQKNTRAALDRTRDILETHGVRVLGAIANDVAPTFHEEYGEERYNNYYRTDLEGASRSHIPLTTQAT
jgi:capsular exopolysaccharide synthesis family protein